MKKALVWKEDYQGRVAGQIERIGEASEIDGWTHHLRERMSIAEVPVELEEKSISELDATLVADKWTKEGEADVFEQPLAEVDGEMVADETWTFVPEHYELSLNVQEDKNRRVSEKYNAMREDVLNDMYVVFGTNRTDTANAYYQTWLKMVESPSQFSSAGLTARFSVGGVSVGDALDTDQKVTDYATAKVVESEAYGVSRMQRIEQFKNEKSAIEAE